MRKRVAVVGSSGFTGKECLRLLARHPDVEIATVMSAREDGGEPVHHPGALFEPACVPLDPAALADLDAVFLCTPHEASARLVPNLRGRVGTIVDLSAAFRLSDPDSYPVHYGFAHPAPALLQEAVFGLTEWARDALPGAWLVANPGCYVTAVLLPLKALAAADCLDPDHDLIADCKSGLSGAGKAATPTTHFAAVHEDFRAYGVGSHRHEPEIREQLGTDRLYFTPHLLPVFRGILATIHLVPRAGLRARDLRAALAARYAAEPFVRVAAENEGLPCLAEVQLTNACHIGVLDHGHRVVVVSCLDNLIKGAAGQAIQNFNLACGLPETHGLEAALPGLPGWR